MPQVETKARGINWLAILGLGCGVPLLLFLLAILAYTLFMGFYVSKVFSILTNPAPIVRTGPYKLNYRPQSLEAKITLPDSQGTLTYVHYLVVPKTHLAGAGERGIVLERGMKVVQQWPLPYSRVTTVKVGLYWYPGKNGLGPYIRFYDMTGESLLDLSRREVGSLERRSPKLYMVDYEYNDTMFSSGIADIAPNGAPLLANGNPAPDVTSVIDPRNCTYLGSVVQRGNKLVFVPNPNSTPARH